MKPSSLIFALAALLFAGCADAGLRLHVSSPTAVPDSGGGGSGPVPNVVSGLQAFDISPGSGWGAYTAQQVGNPASYGYGFYVIGNIAETPYQTFTSSFYVTVIAAHDPTAAQYASGLTSNLQKVCFVVDAGAPSCTTVSTTNPTDGAVGYTAQIQVTGAVPDGQHELRWTATPTDGIELIGQGAIDTLPISNTTTARWVFSTNANGTLLAPQEWVSPSGSDANTCTQGSPCLTIDAARNRCAVDMFGTAEIGGCRIQLMPGASVVLGAATENVTYTAAWRWIVIEGAPGNAQGDATITGSGSSGNGIRATRIQFRNLTVNGVLQNVSHASGWLDTVACVGLGQLVVNSDSCMAGNNSAWGDLYATNSSMTQQGNEFNGFYLVANSTSTFAGQGCFGNSATVFNVSCAHLAIGQSPTNYHPDVMLLQLRGANTVVQNLTATNDISGFIWLIDGGGALRDRVLVMNSSVNNQPDGVPSSLSYSSPGNQHLYINSTLLNAFNFDNSGGGLVFSTTGMSFINDTFDHAVPSRTNVRVCTAGACAPS